MSDITLSKAVRSNLLNLQSTADLLGKSQERLSTGLRVNSALDNPTNFFTAQGLNSRASDLSQLLDAVSNAVQTVAAADKGITAITKLVESAQATARQALQTSATLAPTSAVNASVSSGNTTSVSITANVPATAGTFNAGAFSSVNLAAGSSATSASVAGTGFAAVDVSGTGSSATSASVSGTGFAALDVSSGSVSFSVNVNGAGATAITIDSATVTQYNSDNSTSLDETALTAQDVADLINDQFGSNIASVNGGELTLASGTTGTGSTVAVTGYTSTANAGATGLADASDAGDAAVAADSISFSINVDGAGATAITIDDATVQQYNTDNSTALNSSALTAQNIADLINDQFGSNVASVNGGQLSIASSSTGTGSTVAITGYTNNAGGGATGLADGSDAGDAAVAASSISFSINVDGAGAQAITIDAAAVTQYNSDNSTTLNASALTAQNVADLINDQAGANVASVSGGNLSFTSTSTGASSSVAITGYTASVAGGSTGIANNSDSGDAATTGTAGAFTINGRTVTLAGGDDAAAILSKIQAAASGSSGTDQFTVSNSGGTLTLTGTAGNDVVIAGLTGGQSTALGLSNGTTDGTPASTGGANPKRAELVATYNDLLGQIDALAKDASFNGVNLLNGDDLSVLFNEDGTSSLDINGITNTAAGLGLTTLGSSSFDTNTSINSTLDDLKGAIETLRGQSAKFGSNLSVVETRQDFTKQMINVLQTGAANLTLADTNEEAANVLALQTRQQLSSTALSLASQADQNVLRLF